MKPIRKIFNSKLIMLLILASVAFTAGFKGCGGKSVGAGGGNANKDWETVRSVSSTWINLPDPRPPLYMTPGGVKVYSFKPPTQKQLADFDAGIQSTLDRSNWNNPMFDPLDWWKIDGKPYSRLQDYSIVIIPPMGRSESVEHRGCGLIHVRSGFDVLTAIGTNAGQFLVNGRPVAPGGLYLVIAGWYDDEPVESNCDYLRKWGTAAEAEHARAMGAPAIWFAVQDNDFPPNPGHPFFRGPNGEGFGHFGRRPDGTRADYAPVDPKIEQLRNLTLTPEEIREYQRRAEANAEE